MIRLKSYRAHGFDRGASALKEAAWILVKALFFLSPLPLPSSLRCSLLRLFGANIGDGVVIRSGVNISFPWRLTLGDDVWVGEEVMILSLAPIVVESSVCISQRAFLCTGSHNYQKETFDLITRPITVREGSWIAAQAFVGPGVEIGRGSVVAAGSVVVRGIPAGVLVRGNPAAVHKEIAQA